MTGYDENANVERIRQEEQPKYATEIKESLSIGFHLICLRCKAPYYHTWFAMSEMSYRMYSYCPNCIDAAIEALKERDDENENHRKHDVGRSAERTDAADPANQQP